MDRIVIVGCGGSGKSHLARQFGAILGVTPVHLDTLHYDQDWNPLPAEEFAALQRELIAAPRWIIDGNYASSLPIRLTAASTVIFLDLPAATCLLGIARRRLRAARWPGPAGLSRGPEGRLWNLVQSLQCQSPGELIKVTVPGAGRMQGVNVRAIENLHAP